MKQSTVRDFLLPQINEYKKALEKDENVHSTLFFVKPLLPHFIKNYPKNFIEVFGLDGLNDGIVDVWFWPSKDHTNVDVDKGCKVLSFIPLKGANLNLMAQLTSETKELAAVDVMDWTLQKLADYFKEI